MACHNGYFNPLRAGGLALWIIPPLGRLFSSLIHSANLADQSHRRKGSLDDTIFLEGISRRTSRSKAGMVSPNRFLVWSRRTRAPPSLIRGPSNWLKLVSALSITSTETPIFSRKNARSHPQIQYPRSSHVNLGTVAADQVQPYYPTLHNIPILER